MHQSTSVRHRKARLWILGILIMIVGTSLLATQLLTHTPATPANHVPQEGLLSDNLSPFLPSPPSATISPLPSATPTPPPVILYISGAVFAPGVYMLPANARLYDVVLVAGGLTNHADTTRINLAAYIYDADHIHIPYKGEASPPDYAPITDVADRHKQQQNSSISTPPQQMNSKNSKELARSLQIVLLRIVYLMGSSLRWKTSRTFKALVPQWLMNLAHLLQ